MEIAILVFFAAIFGGVLFLLALIWFVFRLLRKKRASNRNFSSGANPRIKFGSTDQHNDFHNQHLQNSNYVDSDDTFDGVYANNSAVENQNYESPVSRETAHESPQQTEPAHSHHTSHSEYSAPPAEPSYSESSSSSYDSGSSSSDSGSSSSSSD